VQVGEIEKFVWNMENEYDDQTKQNDIIILKLKSPLSLNSKVQSACLPSANWAPENDINNKCFVSGWGALKHAGSSPKTLQWVKVPAISNHGYGYTRAKLLGRSQLGQAAEKSRVIIKRI